MSKLHRVSSGEKSDYQGDVVFVYCLGGHYAETWGAKEPEWNAGVNLQWYQIPFHYLKYRYSLLLLYLLFQRYSFQSS